jgi:hypothetical protein
MQQPDWPQPEVGSAAQQLDGVSTAVPACGKYDR